MKNNWIDLYQNSVLDTYKIKVNSLYVLKTNFQMQYIISKIDEASVFLTTRNGVSIIRNIRWCVENLKEAMRL